MHKINMQESLEMAQRIIALLVANFEQNYRVESTDHDNIAACEMRNYRVTMNNFVIQLLDGKEIENIETKSDKRIDELRGVLKKEKDELQRSAIMGEIRAHYMFLSMID